MINRSLGRPLVGCLIFMILLLFLIPNYDRAASTIIPSQPASSQNDAPPIGSVPAPATTPSIPAARDEIPNILHFVYVLADPSADLVFQFKHYLSLYAASHYWKPDKIYLHTNAREEALSRARAGSSGKWGRLVFDVPGVVVNSVAVPTHANNGQEIKNIEHKSDFVRVKTVADIGGIYIDFDVYALRDIKLLRATGFKAIAGRQYEGKINSGVFMGVKDSKMVRLWIEGMHDRYTGGWTIHSNDVLTRVAEKLTSEPGEVLIMEQNAFAPGSWYEEDELDLWMPHDDVPSNLANRTQGDALPSFHEQTFDTWAPKDKDDGPDWARDWSSSYMLHAFGPRFVPNREKYPKITPRYVLERRSNFARAVYPIAKEMYDKGLIEFDD